MRLEMENVKITDIQEADKTHVENGVLYINKKELEEVILEDEKIASVEINFAKPGQNVRILNVQDVQEPRCKVGVENADYPGVVGNFCIAGQGKTRRLEGAAIVVSNPTTRRVENGLLDMNGESAQITPYSKKCIVSLTYYPSELAEERPFEENIKRASLRAGVFLARAAEGAPVDSVDVYESSPLDEKAQGLPRIGLVLQAYTPQFDYMAVPDKIIYGTAISGMLPTVLHPNEVIDGGLVGWNAMKAIDTLSFQNHAMVREMLSRHGKEINFVGVICVTANTMLDLRMRCSSMVAGIAKHVLCLDGVVVEKILGGMPHADISTMGVALERAGVKTATFTTPLTSAGTLGDTILYNDKELDLIINAGNPFEKTTFKFKADTFYGGTAETKIYSSEQVPQFAGDEQIRVEQYLIAGCQDHCGSRNVITKEF
ncbi:MAG: hypothetical protein IJG63_08565 [Oscillospiraceae bacterium]|nr:hypothetical protein [Oscillospiraceae bacterium]